MQIVRVFMHILGRKSPRLPQIAHVEKMTSRGLPGHGWALGGLLALCATVTGGCLRSGGPNAFERIAGPGAGLPSRSLSASAPGVVRGAPEPRSHGPLPLVVSRVQLDEYATERRKSVIELQQFRKVTRMTLDAGAGGLAVATLTDLNPQIGAWYLLRLETPSGSAETYHLETPGEGRLLLDPEYRSGIVIVDETGRHPCALWPEGTATPLKAARASGFSYAPLCEGRLYVPNQIEGHRTSKEQVTDMLRDHVWGGERITGFVRETFFRDAWRSTSLLSPGPVQRAAEAVGAPPAPLLATNAADRLLVPADLGISLEGEAQGRVAVGRWYPAKDNPGVFVSAVRADLVSPAVVEAQKGRVEPLDALESESLAYLVAFDLERFDLGFAVGTDHPRVTWSDMALPMVRDESLPGPDGIANVEPLARTGMLSPAQAVRVAATFTAGFKRGHGAFRMSDLASVNRGSHYGFIENGVVLSKLQPGLATVVVFDDGEVALRTWTEQDDVNLPRIRHARQNGVPILEYDEASAETRPGSRVRQWGPGNWSGSADKKLRTLRAGLCLAEAPGKRFLTYGYFSSATPSSMARVFQAYGCQYAMLLDMNALEHTYLAVYHLQDSELQTQHLIDGMSVVDGSKDGHYLPRFVSFPDNRDFFYLLRRKSS